MKADRIANVNETGERFILHRECVKVTLHRTKAIAIDNIDEETVTVVHLFTVHIRVCIQVFCFPLSHFHREAIGYGYYFIIDDEIILLRFSLLNAFIYRAALRSTQSERLSFSCRFEHSMHALTLERRLYALHTQKFDGTVACCQRTVYNSFAHLFGTLLTQQFIRFIQFAYE